MFESDLHYTDEKPDFSSPFQNVKTMPFSHAVGQKIVANSLSDNDYHKRNLIY